MARPSMASACAWGLALVVSVMALAPASAGADPVEEGLLLQQLNSSRARSRLGPLTRSPDLDAIARRHAARIAGAPVPFHNPALAAETPGWIAVGEVVGRIEGAPGWDSRLQQLWLGSPLHRRVVLSSTYTMVGIGTVRTGTGVVNAVEVFGRPPGAEPARAARAPRAARTDAVRAAPRTAPAPPPTTAPPTSTTTTIVLSHVALAPLPPGPQHLDAPITPAPVRHEQPTSPLVLGAAAAQLAAAGSVASCATRSRRAGRRRPSC